VLRAEEEEEEAVASLNHLRGEGDHPVWVGSDEARNLKYRAHFFSEGDFSVSGRIYLWLLIKLIEYRPQPPADDDDDDDEEVGLIPVVGVGGGKSKLRRRRRGGFY